MVVPSNIDSLVSERELKFVFVGGKGGVGKTTTSSAVATLFARSGRRTLLVSTDPAHSLGDAFRERFSNEPSSPSVPNLDVMEIDPADSLREALAEWGTLAGDAVDGHGDDDDDDTRTKIESLREWLSGVPGIDEATALSKAITHIESGKYDLIVFDTAPTGHTLKLLQLPGVLEAGIAKLQSWQSTLYGYWDAVKGLASTGSTEAAAKRADAKERISRKLESYKRDVQKVALMLKDTARTRFVVVCIAEYLSVSETRRLLSELDRHGVKASHVVVNQLVVNDALSPDELHRLEAATEVGALHLDGDLSRKAVGACRLLTSRAAVQNKYLDALRDSEEAASLEGLCEVPLLSEEVTGVDALRDFSRLLVTDHVDEPGLDASTTTTTSKGGALYDDQLDALNQTTTNNTDDEAPWSPSAGDAVRVQNLAKSAQYNGLPGTVVADLSKQTGRYGVEVTYQNKRKTLALQLKNIAPRTDNDNPDTKKPRPSTDPTKPTPSAGGIDSQLQKILRDPEIAEMIGKNPKFEAAVKDCAASPMNAMRYMADPEMSPLVGKIMSKMM